MIYLDENLVQAAMEMIREDPSCADGWRIGNSLAGSLLNIAHGTPRQYAEPIVGEALRRVEAENAKPA